MAPAGIMTERSADDDVALDFNLTLLLLLLSLASTLSIPMATPVVLLLLLLLLWAVGLSLLSNKIPAKLRSCSVTHGLRYKTKWSNFAHLFYLIFNTELLEW